MNIQSEQIPCPDTIGVPSEMMLENGWDSHAVSEMIRAKCVLSESPAFLFLGKKEAGFLREHLASAFGEEAVSTLSGTYYMGLEVVEIDCESFIATGGRKISRTLQDPISRRPAWRDRQTDTLWQFRV